MPPPTSSHRLRDVPLFAGVHPDILDALARTTLVRRYPKGQVLCSEGDPGDSLLVLEEGQARVSRFTAAGRETVLASAAAPAAFGELALIDGGPRSATVIAVTPVVVRVLGRRAFLDLLAGQPAVAMALLRTLAGMVRATNERLADLLSLDVPGRLAKWLLARAGEADAGQAAGISVPVGLSQAALAAELGSSRESINKALKRFEALGVLSIERDRITLHRPDLLLAYTQD